MPCPTCGSTVREPISPGFFRCLAIVETPGYGPGRWGQPGPEFVARRAPCRTEYQEGAPVTGDGTLPPLCSCNTFAVGRCSICRAWVCGNCSEMIGNERFCRSHRRESERKAAAQEAKRRQQAVTTARDAYERGIAASVEAAGSRIGRTTIEAERLLLAFSYAAENVWVLERLAPDYFSPSESPHSVLDSLRPPWDSAAVAMWFAQMAAGRVPFSIPSSSGRRAGSGPGTAPIALWWTPKRRQFNFRGWVLPSNRRLTWPAFMERPATPAPVFVREDGVIWSHPAGTVTRDGVQGPWLTEGGVIDGASLREMTRLLALIGPEEKVPRQDLRP